MSMEPMLFEPEVEAILREIASDPRSSLLRVSRPRHLLGLFERYTNVGPQTVGLTAAERHLLQVYRNEVARLLGDVCRRRLVSGERPLNRSLTVDSDLVIPSEAENRERSRALQPFAGELDEPDVESLLERCASGDPTRQPSVTALAAAMARLVPSDSARGLAGLDLALRGQPRAALRLHHSILAGSPSPLMASIAWENVGFAQELLRSQEAALDGFRIAALTDLGRSFPALVWLQRGLVMGLADESLRAASRVNELLGPDDKTLDWYVRVLQQWKIQGAWEAHEHGRRLALGIREQVDGPAGMLADAWA
jgi:hypothetical protein